MPWREKDRKNGFSHVEHKQGELIRAYLAISGCLISHTQINTVRKNVNTAKCIPEVLYKDI